MAGTVNCFSPTVALGLDPWGVPLSEVAKYWPVAVSFGGGLNSTALLIHWAKEKWTPPHKIIFADTGAERAETYWHLGDFAQWLVAQGMPNIEVTRKGGRKETLEEYCLRTKHLPSLAYGGKSCSFKFKIEPQERDINRWSLARQAWAAGTKVVKIIGYGAEEQKRISRAKLEDEKYFYRFPLDELGMDRDACERTIVEAGRKPPPKSSCFFCPSTKKQEIFNLPEDLKRRAINIEVVSSIAGNSRSTKGLGRQFAWSELLKGENTPEAIVAPCMYCADGEAAL